MVGGGDKSINPPKMITPPFEVRPRPAGGTCCSRVCTALRLRLLLVPHALFSAARARATPPLPSTRLGTPRSRLRTFPCVGARATSQRLFGWVWVGVGEGIVSGRQFSLEVNFFADAKTAVTPR